MVTTNRRRGVNATAAIKVACVCATTGNITLSGEQTIDGIATDETRVFVKNQTDATEIGIYRSSTGTWTREPDFDGEFDVAEGTVIPVSRGTANSDTYWRITNTGTITIGTTEITVAATTVLSSAILNDGSVKMIANFLPNVDATYSVGSSTAQWTSLSLSSAMNSNSAAVSSNAVVGGTFTSSGTVTMSSNAQANGTFTSVGTLSASNALAVGDASNLSGTVTMSSDIKASLLTTSLSGTDPGVEGQLWVSTSTGATAGKVLLVSTGP
jgi:uncharacterized cupin superfamily protein